MVAIVCTGFHRSATSVTAQILHKSGLPMGDDLMAPYISNPDGHYEDWEGVRLHLELLLDAKTNWMFSDEVSLPDAYSVCKKIKPYILSRQAKSQSWGFKDPRTCLFLNGWDMALQYQGFYIFVFRHWSACLQSLIKRQSRELAHNEANNISETASSSVEFWNEPDKAALMWMSYNQRILSFVNAHPDRCMLISQEALFNGFPLVDTLNKRLGLCLTSEKQNVIKPDLLTETVDESIIKPLSITLIAKLDRLYDGLNSSSNAPSELVPKIVPSKIQISPKLMKSLKHKFSFPALKIYTYHEPYNLLDAIEKTKEALKLNSVDELKNLKAFFRENYSKEFDSLIYQARIDQKLQNYEEALDSLYCALSLNPRPYLYIEIGDIKSRQGKLHDAYLYYLKGIEKNPKNPLFYLKLGQLEEKYISFRAAFESYKTGYSLTENNKNFIYKLTNLLVQEKKYSDALFLLEENEPLSHRLKLLKARIEMSLDFEKGYHAHIQSVRSYLKNSDLLKVLTNLLGLIHHRASFEQLLYWILLHWYDVLGEDKMKKEYLIDFEENNSLEAC